jgi:hypothetical protein
MAQDQLEQNKQKILSTKQTKSKRAGSMAQVVEHLPSKLEATSSNPNTAKTTVQKCMGNST